MKSFKSFVFVMFQVDQRQPAVVDVAGLDAPNIGTGMAVKILIQESILFTKLAKTI